MRVVALNLEDGAERAITVHPMAFVGEIDWLSDGKGLLMVATDSLPRTDQIWYLSYPDGATHKITDDANRYRGMRLGADSTLVTTQMRRRRNIWIVPVQTTERTEMAVSGQIDATRARQITSGYIGLSWTPDGQLVYTSMASGTASIWQVDADGTHPRQLASVGLNSHVTVSRDGRAIVFESTRDGEQHIWRMDRDGANARQVTNGGGETNPRITPDGQTIVYNSSSDLTLWRIPLAGGQPTQLTQTYSGDPAVSPDGSLIAYNFRDTQASPQWKVAVIPARGGAPHKVFDRVRAEYHSFELNWTPDGRAVTYEASLEGVSNIWSQPLSGGPPRRLTNFTTDYIYGFGWSFDGRQLAVVRGSRDTDVVLFSLRR
jgi:Tol biopolymer transport system component